MRGGPLAQAHLLQLSLLELKAVVQQELQENPFLEEESETCDRPPSELLGGQGSSLVEHLRRQLRLASSDPATRAVGEAVVGNLDANGYLHLALHEAAESAGTSTESVEHVLQIIHAFDPPGIAARTVSECLLLQFRVSRTPDPVAIAIVERHLEDLGRCRYRRIARTLRLPLARIQEGVEEIRRLEPKPGRPFGVLERGEIVPDVLVEKTASDYDVTASDAWPKVRVRTDIHRIARAADRDARRYVNEKRHSAATLLEAIEEKRGLLCRVVKGLITLCPQCFEDDVRPINRVGFWQVAREIGASEHRVTRVTANAYVATPRGLFHLRDCFHWGRGSGDGPELPSPRGGGPHRVVRVPRWRCRHRNRSSNRPPYRGFSRSAEGVRDRIPELPSLGRRFVSPTGPSS